MTVRVAWLSTDLLVSFTTSFEVVFQAYMLCSWQLKDRVCRGVTVPPFCDAEMHELFLKNTEYR